MQDNATNIKKLREKIDAIDSQIIQLIDKRTEVVLDISKNKAQGPSIRTGRESEVLKRVLSQAPTNFPRKAMIRIWRELVSVYSQLQNSYSIGLCAPSHSVGYWDIARDYFGSSSKIILYKSPKILLQKISDDPSFIGIFPHPSNEQDSDWWKNIGIGSNKQTNIIARLPYGGKSDDQFEELEAVAVASFPSEVSGEDRSWIIIEFNEKKSTDFLTMITDKLGISCELICQIQESKDIYLYLLDAKGFYQVGASSLNDFINKEEEIMNIRSIGSYAL